MRNFIYLFLFILLSLGSALAQPAITGVLVPQFMVDTTKGTSEGPRTPVIVRAKLTGLTASATYRYETKAVSLFYMNGATAAFDGATSTGAGNPIYMHQSGNFTTSSSPSMSTSGGYDSLAADVNGEYEGWFGIEPTSNARFAPGNYIHFRIVLNSGVVGNTSVAYYLTVSDSIKTMAYGTGTSQGSGVFSRSLAADKNIAVLWDNVLATGRPLGLAIIENDGMAYRSASSPTNYPLYYRNNVDTISGAWGTIIPNTNSNGVRRIDNRKLTDGSIYYANLDADGVWPTGNISTVNPSAGYAAIKLDSNDVPLVPNPTLFFAQPTYSVNENGTSVTIGVKYKNPTVTSTSVDVAVKTGGSATAGSDYTFTGTTLTFSVTDTMKTITIPINNDILVEGNETFILRLTNATSGVSFTADSVTTVTIIDDDLTSPIYYFDKTTYSIAESGSTVTVAVKYKNAATLPTSVDVSVKTGGTATAGSDFTFSTTTLNFTSADTMKTIAIPITNDVLVEGNETFLLRLTNATSGCTITADSVTTITIIDDDLPPPTVSLVNTKQSVGEGAGTSSVSVKLSTPATTACSVSIAAVNGTATAADYTFTNTTLNFAIGDSVKTATFTINDDVLVEGTEYFIMQLSNATNTTLGNAADTVSITDNDYPRYPIGQISTVNAVTGVADSLNKKYDEVGIVYGINYRPAGLQFVIRDNTGGITVFKATGGYGYTVKQGDSVRVPGTVAQFNGLTEFNADTVIVLGTNKSIKTPVVITKLVEANENDLVRMNGVQFDVPITTWPTGAANISVHNATDTMIIRLQLANSDILGTPAPIGAFDVIGLGSQFDNTNPYTSGYQLFPRFLSDIIGVTSPAKITVDTTAINFNEGGGTVKVKLTISNVNGVASTVNIVNTGTATAGTDYTAPAATATFPANALNGDSILISYAITDDAVVEGNETIIIGVTSNSNATVVGSSKTITIVDNDFPAAKITIDTTSLLVTEGVGTVKVKVKISNVNGSACTVNLAFSGTATSGTDYTAPATSITFPASAVNGDSIMVSYAIINDVVFEPVDETIITTYTAGANCAINGGASQKITITDNDPNGIQNNANNVSLTVYPNPSNGTFTVKSVNAIELLRVYDAAGHEIITLQPNTNKVQLENLAQGLYIMVAQTKDGLSTQRILVK